MPTIIESVMYTHQQSKKLQHLGLGDRSLLFTAIGNMAALLCAQVVAVPVTEDLLNARHNNSTTPLPSWESYLQFRCKNFIERQLH